MIIYHMPVVTALAGIGVRMAGLALIMLMKWHKYGRDAVWESCALLSTILPT